MSDLFGNHIVGFPTRRLICFYDRSSTRFLVILPSFKAYIKPFRVKLQYGWRTNCQHFPNILPVYVHVNSLYSLFVCFIALHPVCSLAKPDYHYYGQFFSPLTDKCSSPRIATEIFSSPNLPEENELDIGLILSLCGPKVI